MLFILGILKKIIHKLIWTCGKYERDMYVHTYIYQKSAEKTFYEKSPHKFTATWTNGSNYDGWMGHWAWMEQLTWPGRRVNIHSYLLNNLATFLLTTYQKLCQNCSATGPRSPAPAGSSPSSRLHGLRLTHCVLAAPFPLIGIQALHYSNCPIEAQLPVRGIEISRKLSTRDGVGRKWGLKKGASRAQLQKGEWLPKGVQHMQSNLNVGHRLSTRLSCRARKFHVNWGVNEIFDIPELNVVFWLNSSLDNFCCIKRLHVKKDLFDIKFISQEKKT